MVAAAVAAVAAVLLLVVWAVPASAGTVTVVRSGDGLVTSSPAGINCGSDCSQSYAGTEECHFDPIIKEWICFTVYPTVTLTATTPEPGWTFTGWGAPCSNASPTCAVYANPSRSVTATFADVQAPTAALTSPGTGIKSGSIVLTATAGDNAAVTKVEFRVRGVLVATDTAAPYTTTFNTASVGDGAAEVRATAFDAAGHTTASTQAITIDNLAPALTITKGPDGVTLGPGAPAEWEFTASDGGSGLDSVQCSVVVATASADAFGPCSTAGKHSAGALPDGSYRFAVRARDKVPRETIRTRTFALDTTGPVTQITVGPPDGASFGETAVAFAFTADEPATFACRVYPAALSPGEFVPCTEAGAHSAVGFSPGTYAFEVVGTDGLGTLGAAVKRTFTVLAVGSGGSGGSGGPGGPTAPSGAAPVVDVGLGYAWAVRGGRTRVVAMTLKRLKPAMKVAVRCSGPGCAFKRKTPAVKGAKLSLVALFEGRALRTGATIEVRVTQAGFTGKVFRYVMRKGKRPSSRVLCLEPGFTTPAAC